jgi:hypothetical protein
MKDTHKFIYRKLIPHGNFKVFSDLKKKTESSPRLKGTLGEIDFLSATGTCMRPIKFVRKDLFFLSAVRTFAGKRP